MKTYKIKWEKYPEYCELCNEHHQYTQCPKCDQEISEIGLRVDGPFLCNCGQMFSIWEDSFVECEWFWTIPDRFNIVTECSHGDNIEFECTRVTCPIR